MSTSSRPDSLQSFPLSGLKLDVDLGHSIMIGASRPRRQGAFPTCLVSGGQTGADRAGLDFAIERGLQHGGYCPKGRRAKDGPLDARYQLTETKSDGWSERTRRNVEHADATVIFSRKPLNVLLAIKRGSGSALTVRECQRAGKAFVVLAHYPDAQADAEELDVFLERHAPQVLNVAGNSEDSAPGTYSHVRDVLSRVAARLHAGVTTSQP